MRYPSPYYWLLTKPSNMGSGGGTGLQQNPQRGPGGTVLQGSTGVTFASQSRFRFFFCRGYLNLTRNTVAQGPTPPLNPCKAGFNLRARSQLGKVRDASHAATVALYERCVRGCSHCVSVLPCHLADCNTGPRSGKRPTYHGVTVGRSLGITVPDIQSYLIVGLTMPERGFILVASTK